MSEVASDGMDEAVAGAVRVAVSASSAAAAQLARARERNAREAQERGQEAARDFAQRREAQWQDTRAQLSPVMQDQWWQGASPEDIGRAYANAKAWEGREEVAPFAGRIRDEVQRRYGVDVDAVGGEHLAERISPESDSERQGEQAQQDRAEAERLMEDADRAERESHTDAPDRASEEQDRATNAEADGRALYDSAERRESMAEGMRRSGVEPEVVAGRVQADTGQGAPAVEAVRGAGKAPKARKGRKVAGQQRDRARGR